MGGGQGHSERDGSDGVSWGSVASGARTGVGTNEVTNSGTKPRGRRHCSVRPEEFGHRNQRPTVQSSGDRMELKIRSEGTGTWGRRPPTDSGDGNVTLLNGTKRWLVWVLVGMGPLGPAPGLGGGQGSCWLAHDPDPGAIRSECASWAVGRWVYGRRVGTGGGGGDEGTRSGTKPRGRRHWSGNQGEGVGHNPAVNGTPGPMGAGGCARRGVRSGGRGT